MECNARNLGSVGFDLNRTEQRERGRCACHRIRVQNLSTKSLLPVDSAGMCETQSVNQLSRRLRKVILRLLMGILLTSPQSDAWCTCGLAIRYCLWPLQGALPRQPRFQSLRRWLSVGRTAITGSPSMRVGSDRRILAWDARQRKMPRSSVHRVPADRSHRQSAPAHNRRRAWLTRHPRAGQSGFGWRSPVHRALQTSLPLPRASPRRGSARHRLPPTTTSAQRSGDQERLHPAARGWRPVAPPHPDSGRSLRPESAV